MHVTGDWGGNFFCINKNTSYIIYYTTDNFYEELSIEQNHINQQRIIAPSFCFFVNNLIDEEDAF